MSKFKKGIKQVVLFFINVAEDVAIYCETNYIF